MKKYIIGYFILFVAFLVMSTLLTNFISGVLFTIALVLFTAFIVESRDYYIYKKNTLINKFYVLTVNGKSKEEIIKILNISEKTFKKIEDYLLN